MRTLWLATVVAVALAAGAVAQQQPSTPQQTAPSATAPSTSTTEPPATSGSTVATTEPKKLLGKDVYGSDGKKIGEIDNILVTPDGKAKAVVIEYGGLLGIGSKDAIVEWEKINVSTGDKPTLNMTEDQLKQQPSWDKDKPDPRFADAKPVK